MQEVDVAFIAGFFEGDGCIQSRGNPPYPVVTFGQKEPDILRWIQSRIGGRLYQHRRGHWILSLGTKALVISFIQQVSPFTIVKRDQLSVGLKLAYLVGTNRREERYRLHKELSEMKHA